MCRQDGMSATWQAVQEPTGTTPTHRTKHSRHLGTSVPMLLTRRAGSSSCSRSGMSARHRGSKATSSPQHNTPPSVIHHEKQAYQLLHTHTHTHTRLTALCPGLPR